jgi:ribonuclease PH
MPLSNCLSVPLLTEDDAFVKKSLGLVCSVGQVCDVSGSALVTEGGAEVLCSVHGPRSSQKNQTMDSAQVDCEVRYAPLVEAPTFSTFGTTGVVSTTSMDTSSSSSTQMTTTSSSASGQPKSFIEKMICENLRVALLGMIRVESYPKMNISIHTTVMESSGNIGQDLAAAITCVSLALADASIEMLDLVTASTVGLPSEQGGQPIIHHSVPVGDQRASSYVTVCSRCNAPEIPQIWSEGRLNAQQLFRLLEEGCRRNTVKQTLVEAALREKVVKGI